MLATLLLCLPCASTAPLPSAVRAAQDAQVVDERPEVKALIDELAAHIKARGEEDEQARGVLDKLHQEFTNCGPKDRAAVVKALAACFDAKRPKELEEGVPDDRLYQAAAVALGNMGPESVKVLIPLIGDKTHRKNMRLQQTLAHALGKTKSPDGLKTLLGLLKHKDPPMQAAGAESLASYADSSDATRKGIFEELLQTLMDQFTKKETNPTDQEAGDRWNTISGPIIEALQKLSGHSETSPEQWLKWWNDNKKKDWGAKAG
jgi:HEAT repeat protein